MPLNLRSKSQNYPSDRKQPQKWNRSSCYYFNDQQRLDSHDFQRTGLIERKWSLHLWNAIFLREANQRGAPATLVIVFFCWVLEIAEFRNLNVFNNLNYWLEFIKKVHLKNENNG